MGDLRDVLRGYIFRHLKVPINPDVASDVFKWMSAFYPKDGQSAERNDALTSGERKLRSGYGIQLRTFYNAHNNGIPQSLQQPLYQDVLITKDGLVLTSYGYLNGNTHGTLKTDKIEIQVLPKIALERILQTLEITSYADLMLREAHLIDLIST